MPPKNKGEGVKIAQAAKELNVTSVTIRRYITEFNIETTSDENGIKVLPAAAMDELQEIRRLKEDGLTNPQVTEALEKRRTSGRASGAGKDKEKEKEKETKKAVRKVVESQPVPGRARKLTRSVRKEMEDEEESVEETITAVEPLPAETADVTVGLTEEEDSAADGKTMHSLTCQTCSKTFEHMNPKLRDCLDCYRAKRRERRRGGDKHKNVIQHPLAQQVANKAQQAQQLSESSASTEAPAAAALPSSPQLPVNPVPVVVSPPRISLLTGAAPQLQRVPVRNYRKAIEETRQITSNLKRRLERPDLTEAERRFLEQIYAYQLILHQGWKHLSEYRSGGSEQRYDGQSSNMQTPRTDS